MGVLQTSFLQNSWAPEILPAGVLWGSGSAELTGQARGSDMGSVNISAALFSPLRPGINIAQVNMDWTHLSGLHSLFLICTPWKRGFPEEQSGSRISGSKALLATVWGHYASKWNVFAFIGLQEGDPQVWCPIPAVSMEVSKWKCLLPYQEKYFPASMLQEPAKGKHQVLISM